MKFVKNIARKGFTLVELITAMAITTMLVWVIMQLTVSGIDLWKKVRTDVSTSSRSRVALQTVGLDLQALQMTTDNKYEWLVGMQDKRDRSAPKGLKLPSSARLIFFSCPPDRNPAVGNTSALRRNYREARAHNLETQGDVSAICYSLKYHDQILNLSGSASGSERGSFPLFSLYRTVVSPRDSFEKLLGQTDLDKAFRSSNEEEERHFLCENIVEFNVIFTIQYPSSDASIDSGRVQYETVLVPVVSSRGNAQRVDVYGDRVVVGGTEYKNARVVAANLSICVLTEEGVALAEQIRQGRRRAPKQADFFAKYTRSYSSMVPVPSPL